MTTEKMTIQVKTEAYGEVVATVQLTVQYMGDGGCHGWRCTRYKGRRYEVFGGVRTPDYIYLNNPIPKRSEYVPSNKHGVPGTYRIKIGV